MMEKIVVNLFKRDLRLIDNLSFYESSQKGAVIPIYIFDDTQPEIYKIGNASKWWLHHSLISLKESLNNNICFFFGDPKEILLSFCKKYSVNEVCWSKSYTTWEIKKDQEIKDALILNNIKVNIFNTSLLQEPNKVLKADNTPYKIFTSFYKKGYLSNKLLINNIIPIPNKINFFFKKNEFNDVNNLKLLFDIDSSYNEQLLKHWKVGEKAAILKFNKFLDNKINQYKQYRDYPAQEFISKLSPHLHFGEISLNYVWNKINNLKFNENIHSFLIEIVWKEFSNYLLYHFPSLPEENLQNKFNKFPWNNNEKHLLAWQKGMTGYPIVDAGMIQLKQEGYMHNRVRMIVGSFLVKNLLLHWKLGAIWFWNSLVDADLASNSVNWQWVGGCGTDATPYFRIFNPITQGEKFDTEGEYTKKYLPQLKYLPKKYLFCPWTAPKYILNNAGITLGENYYFPIVDLKESRNLALNAYSKLNNKL